MRMTLSRERVVKIREIYVTLHKGPGSQLVDSTYVSIISLHNLRGNWERKYLLGITNILA